MPQLNFPENLNTPSPCNYFTPLMCIVSVQGDLESRVGEVDMGGKLIGDLSFSKDGSNTPLLIIGHHILYGKLVKMENPMVVMHKVTKIQVCKKSCHIICTVV